MKRPVLLTIVLLSLSSLALAQIPGSIGVFTNQLGTDCNILDSPPPAVLPVYIVHVGTSGSTASQWMLEWTAGVTMSYVGESSPFQTKIGTAPTGVNIGYQACMSGTFLILTVNMFKMGTTPACEMFSIVPDTAYSANGFVQIVDCNFVNHELTKGGQARINPDASCICNVAVRESTWGRVKTLYE
jgi:hypothetical protein